MPRLHPGGARRRNRRRDVNATIHPLDYARTLAATDDLPDELVGRSRTVSSTPAWLRFGAAAPARADSRGQGRGRGGRGRGRRQGRGPPGIDQLQGMPTLPELPPEPSTPRMKPLRGRGVAVHWIPASRRPRERPWLSQPNSHCAARRAQHDKVNHSLCYTYQHGHVCFCTFCAFVSICSKARSRVCVTTSILQ